MARKIKGNIRLNRRSWRWRRIFTARLISHETADKITKRVLGSGVLPKPQPLAPEEIRALRDEARMSQSVFAAVLNVTSGYLSQLEREEKRPTGAALAMLNVIRRKGIEAVL